ncbi:MAG TPA: division/cell wall cluster transcriptional repressor MraZ [Firmicutes bacterium]|nr:division/cell wall cluster transcriptional repressor MraZ [Bacillota bacterium]
MLFGNFTYSIDSKGRLVIPAKFRMAVNDTLYAMRGYEQCLSLYPQSSFEKLQADLEKLSFMQKGARDYMRIALSSTLEMSIDDHGRIQIPVAIVKRYQLEGTVRVIGVQDHIEIWSEQAWTAYEKEADASFETTAASLADHHG